MPNKTAVEWLFERIVKEWELDIEERDLAILDQAKELEKKQLFLASNTSAKEAYKAGQKSMYCGCYEISGCTTYEDWLYNETFKSE